MEREIIFRGKRLEIGQFAAEKACEWVYGGYAKDCSGAVHIYDTTRASRMVRVDPNTIGQYTGLNDRNGVKIFEGDIIRDIDTGDSSEIIYTVPKFTRRTRDGWYLYHFCGGESYEVIGNIHDNQSTQGSDS